MRVEKVKKIILVILISYVIIFSALLFKQVFNVNRKLSSNVILVDGDNSQDLFKNFIKSKREQLTEYRLRPNSKVNSECLNKVSYVLDDADNFYNENIKTYKDLLNGYVNVYGTTYSYNMFDVCGFNELESQEIKKIRDKRTVLMSEVFIDVLNNYQIQFNDYNLLTEKKWLETQKKELGLDIVNRLIENEKEYIEKLFEVLGDKYE